MALVITDVPVFGKQANRLLLPVFQHRRRAFVEVGNLLGQRETAGVCTQQHAVATAPVLREPVDLPLLALHQHHIAQTIHPIVMQVRRPGRERRRRRDIQRHDRYDRQRTRARNASPGTLLVGPNQQQTHQIRVSLQLTVQPDQGTCPVGGADGQSAYQANRESLIQIADRSCGVPTTVNGTPTIQHIDTGHLFQSAQNLAQALSVMRPQRVGRPAAVPCRMRTTLGEERDLGVAEVPERMRQRPHRHGFPLMMPIVVQRLQPASNIIRQHGIRRALKNAPRHGIRGENTVDERLNGMTGEILVQHVGKEVLDQFARRGLVREDEMQVPEELLHAGGVIAQRIHDVIPTGGVRVHRGGGQS